MSKTDSISYWTSPKIIVRLTYALDRIRQPKDFVDFHIHPANELVLIKSGKLHLRIQDRQWILGANTFFALPNSTRHQLLFLEKNTHFINIIFRGTLFDPLILTPLPLTKKEWEIADSLVKNSVPPIELVRCELAAAQLTTLLCMLTLQNNSLAGVPFRIPINRKHYTSKIVQDAIDYKLDYAGKTCRNQLLLFTAYAPEGNWLWFFLPSVAASDRNGKTNDFKNRCEHEKYRS